MDLVERSKTAGGIERGPLPEDQVRTSILVTMLVIAIYQAVVVDVQVFTTFKRRNTLYFWSLLIASWGIMSHSAGVILKWFVGSCPWQVNTALASFGWWGMVTGQSLVLYSRLHLVVYDQRLLRFVLIMVLANFAIFQVPTTVLTFGSNQDEPGMWLKVYNVYERIQLVVFTLQETIISVIYIRAAIRLLRPSDPDDTRSTKKTLIYLNLLCIVLDIAFVAEVYSGEWVYKTGTQSLAYGIKLTIEFVVLNKLVEVARHGVTSSGRGPSVGMDDYSGLNAGKKWSQAAGRAGSNAASDEHGIIKIGRNWSHATDEETGTLRPGGKWSADRPSAGHKPSLAASDENRDLRAGSKLSLALAEEGGAPSAGRRWSDDGLGTGRKHSSAVTIREEQRQAGPAPGSARRPSPAGSGERPLPPPPPPPPSSWNAPSAWNREGSTGSTMPLHDIVPKPESRG
ncbi:MAG: hypothetical protein M1832_000938 [Thelocarpon impressellum]|nr:MAG: hypothetical protein M1832_000938 [Thelocarpon impressellum]